MATVTTEIGTATLVALIKRMFPHWRGSRGCCHSGRWD